jgi:hypothetical protein
MSWKDRLDDLVQKRRWKELGTFVADALNQNRASDDIAIEAIYLLLNVLLYGEWESQEEAGEIERTLRELFTKSYAKFHNNAQYLFFVGYFIALAEWAFGQEDLKLSHAMLKKAAELEPGNLLYKWGYRFSSGDPTAGQLTEKLYLNSEVIASLASKGDAGKYIAEAIESVFKRYNEKII